MLAGSTYASRLWCVVELFVFLKMGGETERIRVLELGGVDVRVALNRFDAAKAKCFLAADREKLLAVIESGFGSLAPFNSLIRGVFRDARATHLESLVVASAEDTLRELKQQHHFLQKIESLEREQLHLHAKIDLLLHHQGVAMPAENELAT